MMDRSLSLAQRAIAPVADSRSGLDPRQSLPDPTAVPAQRSGTGPLVKQVPGGPSSAPVASLRISTLDHLAGLVGSGGAALLIASFGGTRVYIPQEPLITDALSELIGYKALCALAEIYGGDRIEIPNPPPRRVRILELRASGLSIDVIARTLHCTRRRVFQVMAEARESSSMPVGEELKTRIVRHPPGR
jgi:hypothetical protein